jgi:predicted MPP superfamily phosphohydrolase
MTRQLGPPDFVFITGDLTYSGSREQFLMVDSLLHDLDRWIAESAGLNSKPLIVAVPGNHDLVRPGGMLRVQCRILDLYTTDPDDRDLRELENVLWNTPETTFLEPLFAEYRTWFSRSVVPRLQSPTATLHLSRFPGDLSLRVDVDGAFPILVVGLNSAWMHYKEGQFEGKLQLSAEQFQAALGPATLASPLDVFANSRPALLMMHHPPSWLSHQARRQFNESIHTPDRFAICLHGHMHDGVSQMVSESAGPPRYYLQAPSLFGIENYGTRAEVRRIGYVWGRLFADGTIRIWPLERRTVGGRARFVHDSSFPEDVDGVRIRPVDRATRAQAHDSTLTPYLEGLAGQTGYINISAINTRWGSGGRHPIEHLYVPITGREPSGVDRSGTLARDLVGLVESLLAHERLLVVGQAGTGKTTFFRFIACMLARDRLGVPERGWGSWRRRQPDNRLFQMTPVLLRAIDLVTALAEDSMSRDNPRRFVLDLLDEQCRENEYAIARRYWETLLREGRILLLVDGIDEIVDEATRGRIYDVILDASREWNQCRVAVASRPVVGAGLQKNRFHRVMIDPFGNAEIEMFLAQWVNALENTGGQRDDSRRARDFRRGLMAAINEQPRIQKLAENGMMLTFLCVVQWNGGKLPHGLARVYGDVLTWLILAREEARRLEGFTDWFARRAFAALALSMMSDDDPRRAGVCEIERAVDAIMDIIRRDFFELTPDEARQKARQWIQFECYESGVIEKVDAKRLRFWHLTFQEYLAALQLAWLTDEDNPRGWWTIVKRRFEDPPWLETLTLLPGCLLDAGGQARVDLLLRRTLGLAQQQRGVATSARVAWIVGTLGRLLETMDAYHYKPEPEVFGQYHEAIQRCLEIFSTEGSRRVTWNILLGMEGTVLTSTGALLD